MADKDKDETLLEGAKGALDRILSVIGGGGKKKKRKAEDVPLGGMAGEAKKTISGRQRQLDRQIEESGG